jgi:outer membrane protein TolC
MIPDIWKIISLAFSALRTIVIPDLIGNPSGKLILDSRFRGNDRNRLVKEGLILFLFAAAIHMSGIFNLHAATNDVPLVSTVPSLSSWAFIDSARTNRLLRIGMVDCITWTLKNNPDIMIKKIEPKLREDDVKAAEAAFEPSFYAYAGADVNKSPVPMPENVYSSSMSKVASADVGVMGKLKSGTGYQLDFTGSRSDTEPYIKPVNPVYFAEPIITITQPLFKGAGFEVNEAQIHITANRQRISSKGLNATAMETISHAIVAYYNYCYAQEYYAIAVASLKRAQDLLAINQQRYDKGLISSVDLLESDTAVAQNEKTVIAAQAIVSQTEDDLKLVTNLVDDPELWNARLEIIDQPRIELRKTDLADSLKKAFNYRPDYQMKSIELLNRDIAIKVADNNLLPDLSVVGSYGMNGWGSTYGNALNTVVPENNDWNLFLKFSKPWGGGERAIYDQKKREKTQGVLELKRLEQNIIFDVRNCIREVETQRRQMDAAQHAKETELKNYDAQSQRYAVGQTSTHDMLDYQQRVASSETDYLKAVVEYQSALIALDKAEGVTLMKNNIVMEE